MEAKSEQIKELAMRIAKCSRFSYCSIYQYLEEAVMVFNIELPDPNTIDCADFDKLHRCVMAMQGGNDGDKKKFETAKEILHMSINNLL